MQDTLLNESEVIDNESVITEAKSTFKQDMRKVKVEDNRKAGTTTLAKYKEVFKEYVKYLNKINPGYTKPKTGLRNNDGITFMSGTEVKKLLKGDNAAFGSDTNDPSGGAWWLSNTEEKEEYKKKELEYLNNIAKGFDLDTYEEAYKYLDNLVEDFRKLVDSKNIDTNRVKSLRNKIVNLVTSIPTSQIDQKNIIIDKSKNTIGITWRPSSFKKIDMKKYFLFVHRTNINDLKELRPSFVQYNRYKGKGSFDISIYRDSIIHFWAFEKTDDPKKIARQIKDLNWGGHGFGNEFYLYEPKSTDTFYIDGNYMLAEDSDVENDHKMWGSFHRELVPATIITKRPLPVKKTSLEEIKKMIGYNKGDVVKYLNNDDLANNWQKHDVGEMSEAINKEGPPSMNLATKQNGGWSKLDSTTSEIPTSTPKSQQENEGSSTSDPMAAKSKEQSNEGAPVQAISNNKLGSLLANKKKNDNVVKESALIFEAAELDEEDYMTDSATAGEKFAELRTKIINTLSNKFGVTPIVSKSFKIVPMNGSKNDNIKITLGSNGKIQAVSYDSKNGSKAITYGDYPSAAFSKIQRAVNMLFSNFKYVSESYNTMEFSDGEKKLSRWGIFQEDADVLRDNMDELDLLFDDTDDDDSSDDDNKESGHKDVFTSGDFDEYKKDDLSDNMSFDDIDSYTEPDSIGSDTSNEQNEYDPKELETLNKLISSEINASSEYWNANKETKIPVLSKLYADIGDEERFHTEQLLFAKSQLTGEAYEPHDPEVKKEYEELKAMGMDSETAMTTVMDKRSIGASSSFDDDEDDDDINTEVEESIEALEYALTTAELYSIILESASTANINKCYSVITEAYIFQEAVETNDSNAKVKMTSDNPFKLIGKLIKKICHGLRNLTVKIRKWREKMYRRNRAKTDWIKRHGIKALFESGISLYFYDDARPDMRMDTVFFQLIDRVDATLVAMGKKYGINITQSNMNLPQRASFASSQQGVQALKNINLIKTKVIVNDKTEASLEKKFFGETTQKIKDINGNEVSANTFNMFTYCLDVANNYLENKVQSVLNAIEGMSNNQNSIYYKNPKAYKELEDDMKVISDTMDKIIKALTHDLAEYVKVNNACTKEATAEADAIANGTAPKPEETTTPAVDTSTDGGAAPTTPTVDVSADTGSGGDLPDII